MTWGPRREYLLTLALGAVGAAGVLLCVRQRWAQVVTPAPRPLPTSTVAVSGQGIMPLAGALAVASLAGLVAVIATRGRPRRLIGVLLAVFGAVIAWSVTRHLATADVLAAAHTAGVPHAGSATAGGAGLAPGGADEGALPGVSTTGHAVLTGGAWRPLAAAAALAVTAAGVLTAWRAGRWPAMSGRYERGAAPRGAGAAAPPPAGGAAGMWESLSRGVDPTSESGQDGREPGRGSAEPGHHGGEPDRENAGTAGDGAEAAGDGAQPGHGGTAQAGRTSRPSRR
jgi:uncharacterized membrane protein (TIGR02234 family)